MCPIRQSDPHSNPIRILQDSHRSYEPLEYILMRPNGTDGWHINLRSKSSGEKVSVDEYTRYYIMTRDRRKDGVDQSPNMLHYGGQLFQQFITDQASRAEVERLKYIDMHQEKLRRNSYAKVKKHLQQSTVEQSGKMTVLPASFTGSDRYMYRQYSNAMALVRVFGKPALFITFTMNVNCPEVLAELKDGQTPYNRPEVICRVYWQKYKAFLHEITKDGIFGKCLAHVSVVEFQKRGPPHTHTLFWIKDFDHTAANIDDVISAEIPPKTYEDEDDLDTRDPRAVTLRKLVLKHMIHGPCDLTGSGYSCRRNANTSVCGKGFPHEFADVTDIGEAIYPSYRRRSPEHGGETGRKRINRKVTTIDNSWVVPYSLYLLMKYQSHINVQYCSTVKSIKYLFKYHFKGEDLISVAGLDPMDEVR